MATTLLSKRTNDLAGVAVGANAAASLASLVLVIPNSSNPGATKGYQPLNPPLSDGSIDLNSPPDALLFHYEGENRLKFESDITTHYVESNVGIQDQISIKPETITVDGYIGELNNVAPSGFNILQTLSSTLTSVSAYTPQLSVTAEIAYNEAFFAYQNAASIASSAVSAWSSITSIGSSGTQISNTGAFEVGNGVQNEQQKMFQQFYGYWNNRILFNVQTPWAILTNMAISSLEAIQDETTRMITNFKVTFMRIRTASTVENSFFSALTSGRLSSQSASATNLGTSSGSGNTSLGSSISGVA